MDVAECYPSMSRPVTMVDLAKKGVCDDAWRVMDCADSKLVCMVEVNGVRLRTYPVQKGFLEGLPDSGTKAIASLQAAPSELQRLGHGVEVYGVWVGCVSFVDDNTAVLKGVVKLQRGADVFAGVHVDRGTPTYRRSRPSSSTWAKNYPPRHCMCGGAGAQHDEIRRNEYGVGVGGEDQEVEEIVGERERRGRHWAW
jgi:hypothetical protein